MRTDGSLTEDNGVMEHLVNSFYQNLYTSKGVQDMDRVIGTVQRKVTNGMNAQLNMPYTQEEVKDALYQMFPVKSPGPDGFTAHFFQHHLGGGGGCGEEVTKMVLSIVEGNEST